MKVKLLVIAALASSTIASAQTVLIGGLSFEQLWFEGNTRARAEDGTPLAPQTSVGGLYSDIGEFGDYANLVNSTGDGSSFVPRATMYWDGTNGSSLWDGLTGSGGPGQVGGGIVETIVGETIGTTRRTGAGADLVDSMDYQASVLNAEVFQSRTVRFNAVANNAFSITLDSTGYDLNTFRFAGGLGTAGTAGINWSYRLNGAGPEIAFVPSTSLSATFSAFNFDVSSLFSGNEQLEIIGRFAANTSTGVNVNLDSFQFIGSAVETVIPEPSTYALLLGTITAGICMFRRRFTSRLA